MNSETVAACTKLAQVQTGQNSQPGEREVDTKPLEGNLVFSDGASLKLSYFGKAAQSVSDRDELGPTHVPCNLFSKRLM